MLPFKYPRLWLFAGWTLILICVVGSLLPAHTMHAVPVNDKIEHSGTYLILMLWFAGIYPRARYPIIALSLFYLGLSMEWAQGVMNLGRQRDLNDLLANSCGIAVGLALALTVLEGWAQKLEHCMTAARHPAGRPTRP